MQLVLHAVTSDVKDLVSWIAQDVVQAQENPLTNYMGFELWKYHPYVSLTHHFYGVLLLVCPLAWYDSLNQEDRQLLAYAVKTCTALQRQLAAEQDAITLARMQDIGVKVLPKDAMDMQSFSQKCGIDQFQCARPNTQGFTSRLIWVVKSKRARLVFEN
jgi:TRAP-type C4-dicarboxylate transport system substrate-binding protein